MWTFRHRHKRDIVTITKEKDAKLLLSRRGEWIMLTSPNKPPKLDDELPPEDKAWKTPKMPNPGYSLKPQEVPIEAPEIDVDASEGEDGVTEGLRMSPRVAPDVMTTEMYDEAMETAMGEPAVREVKKRGRKPKNA